MPTTEYIFDEVLNGFNPSTITANKPHALNQGLNLDMESEPGRLKKRNGYVLFTDQLVANQPILGLFSWVKSDGTRQSLMVVNASGGATAEQYYLNE